MPITTFFFHGYFNNNFTFMIKKFMVANFNSNSNYIIG